MHCVPGWSGSRHCCVLSKVPVEVGTVGKGEGRKKRIQKGQFDPSDAHPSLMERTLSVHHGRSRRRDSEDDP